jgi:hypothetical protein
MKLNYKIVTPVLIIGLIVTMIVLSNQTNLTPEQLKEQKIAKNKGRTKSRYQARNYQTRIDNN